MSFETEGESNLTENERKALRKVLAHSNQNVIDKHYIASTIEKQSVNVGVLEKVKATLVMKQTLRRYGAQLRSSKSKKDALELFVKMQPAMASAVLEHGDYLYNLINTSK